MPGSDDVERFAERYAVSGADPILAVEAETLGSDYRANGYTTVEQADELGELLELGPGRVLLDVGAGCGWPGLYLAKRLGCSVMTMDPVAEGIAVAKARTESDSTADRGWVAVADAIDLPLRRRSVDAVVHTDLLC